MVVAGEHGDLEFVSLGDYGKHVNLNQNKTVEDNLPLLSLTEKWVITVSTQYGCSMGCKFCDVPKVGPGRNATVNDLTMQLQTGLALHPEITHTERLNVHLARMGEPTWNRNVLHFTDNIHNIAAPYIGGSLIHPVVSTMMPRANTKLEEFLHDWMWIKNEMFRGDAGLQLSINSTNDSERDYMFSGNALPLDTIASIGENLPHPKGRKITLNFAVAEYEINAVDLIKLFDPAKFIVKLTPMHKTATALEHSIKTSGNYTTSYPYEHHAQALRDVGFDVLVFIASNDEDAGRITCGNAILSGSLPHKFTEISC